MEAFPFQSNFLGFDEQNNPKYDRAVGADFMHEREKLYYKNGVFPNPSTNFQVTAATGLTVNVAPGSCFIQGVTGIEINTTVLTLPAAEELTDRTDLIVLRCDFVNKLIDVAVAKGTTTLTRNSNVWEMKLAEITVPKMALTITQANITDTRLGAECGVVTGAVTTVDTSTLFAEYYAAWQALKALMASNEASYNTWYDAFKLSAETTFNQRITDFDAWFAQSKTAIFDAKYFDFDNWVYRAGETKETIFNADGSITEKIINTTTKTEMASRTTTFLPDGSISERTVVPKDKIDVTKTTTFGADGVIKEVMT